MKNHFRIIKNALILLLMGLALRVSAQNISLSKNSAWASIGIGQVVSDITGGTLPYKLAGQGFDNGAFMIKGNKLLANNHLYIYAKQF